MDRKDLTRDLNDHELLLELFRMFQGFDERQRGFDERQRGFDERLTALERKVDERLYDTRTMWEAVQSQIADLRSDQQTEFRKLNSKFDKLAQFVFEVYADEKELERRLKELAPSAS
jgi:hypothetical protein